MNISVDISSFSLLELGIHLKYADHFEHNSRYLKPISKRLAKIKAKWDRVARLLSRTDTAILLHPVMRSLGMSYIRPKRRLSIKRSLARKLVRRSHKCQTLPSFRPFLCRQCSLSSFSLSVIQKHECRRRKFKGYSIDELEKAASLGIRSGVRAMSAFEMADNLDRINTIPRVKSQTSTNLERSMPVIKNQKVPKAFHSLPNHINVEQSPNLSISHSLPTSSNSQLASFCLTCRKCFGQPKHFEEHTKLNGCKTDDELKFLVNNSNRFPSTGIGFPLNNTLDTIISMLCSNCSRSDFEDSSSFHQHITKCV